MSEKPKTKHQKRQTRNPKPETRNPIGVCVFPLPPRNAARSVSYPEYVHEILQHAGLCYVPVSAEELPEALPCLQLLLTVGETTLLDEVKERLRAWIQAGGAWVSVGGVGGMAEIFGVQVESPTHASWGGGMGTLGEGYLKPVSSSHPLMKPLSLPLHFFNGVPVRATGGKVLARVLDAHGRQTSRAALVESRVGRGCCLLIAADVTGTVVHIQQGRAITRDGVPAPDGTAPISDGVLKSGDGGVLDWLFDRQPVEGAPGLSGFLQPIADLWRELLLRSIFYLAARQKVALPMLWLYPRNLPALAHLSHDTDLNEPEKAWQLLQVLEAGGVRSTWCVILPGYPSEIIIAIREAGHELAMHYDAVSDGTAWSETDFDRQRQGLTELFGGQRPITNKNHYLRWEGDTEFFEWCAKRGIQLDQSKGASKTGEVGFNFGTCHPYFPIAPDGSLLDVLELPTPTQDLIVFAPAAVLEPMLRAVERHHGVLHLLFHPAHLNKPGVAEELLAAIKQARARGMEWWTAREINQWERARRRVHWSRYETSPEGTQVCLRVEESLPGATLLWLSDSFQSVKINGIEYETQTIQRWGFPFQAIIFDAEPGEHKSECFVANIGSGSW